MAGNVIHWTMRGEQISSAGKALASLAIPRAMLSPTSARFLLRGNKLRTFAFSYASASGNSSAVNQGARVSGLQSGPGKFGVPDKFPRPETIPWQKELTNKVHLIGYIGKPVELKYTNTGIAFARTRLGARLNGKSSETTWFTLNFWQEMAEIAAEHVKTGDRVYVSGYMNHDATGDDNNTQTLIKVVVNLLNFIERDSSFSPRMDADMNSSISGSLQEGINIKHATSGSPQEGINMKHAISGSPQESINMKHSNSGSKVIATEKLWQAFFLNPTEWWDNRKDKRNPKAPDFKHKTTGEVLWIDSYGNPPWVKSQLDKLDETMSFSNQLTNPKRSLSSFGDSDFNLF